MHFLFQTRTHICVPISWILLNSFIYGPRNFLPTASIIIRIIIIVDGGGGGSGVGGGGIAGGGGPDITLCGRRGSKHQLTKLWFLL